MNKVDHMLTQRQSERIGIPIQLVQVVLREDHEKPRDLKNNRIAKDVFTLSGERVCGNLELDE